MVSYIPSYMTDGVVLPLSYYVWVVGWVAVVVLFLMAFVVVWNYFFGWPKW